MSDIQNDRLTLIIPFDELTDMQKAELDKCYDDMMKFVKRNYTR